jgi:hypothetical protein
MERQSDVDVVALVEEFLNGAVVAEETETVSIDAPATRAEMALVRHLRRLKASRGALELSPGAYMEAIGAGWMSPVSADVLCRERDRAVDEMAEVVRAFVERREYVAGLEREVERWRAYVNALGDKRNEALTLLYEARRCVGMCSPARNPLTAGIKVVRGMSYVEVSGDD